MDKINGLLNYKKTVQKSISQDPIQKPIVCLSEMRKIKKQTHQAPCMSKNVKIIY